jgi:hypothetical protein
MTMDGIILVLVSMASFVAGAAIWVTIYARYLEETEEEMKNNHFHKWRLHYITNERGDKVVEARWVCDYCGKVTKSKTSDIEDLR